jgi:hypothetical protein
MRLPSIKALARVFEDPKVARRILEMKPSELRAHPATLALCYSRPLPLYDLRMGSLNALDPGLHGVEYITEARAEDPESACYLNTGDMYADTVIYWRGAYRVQSLGDFIETQERNGVKFS